MIRHNAATITRASRKLKLKKQQHHYRDDDGHDDDPDDEVQVAMAMAMELDATPPRSASPILRRRGRPTRVFSSSSRIPPFSTNNAFDHHHAIAAAMLPSHPHPVLSPICLNSNSALHSCSSPADPLKTGSKSALPPPPKHQLRAGDYKYPPAAADEQLLLHTAAGLSSSPAIDSPLISVSVDEEDEEARSKKEGAEEIMVWTNAVFQANSCEETSSNYTATATTATSVDEMNLRYLPLLTAKSCHVMKPQSIQNEETVDESNASSRRGFTDHKSLLNSNPTTANAASGGEDELEEIELQIKQLTDQLKKLQAQKEQVVAKRRNLFKQRPRLGGLARSGCVATSSQSSLAMAARLSHGVPTFKGLRSSQPMKKKQYIPNSGKANSNNNMASVAMKGEDGSMRLKRPVSSIRSGCSAATLGPRIGGYGVKPPSLVLNASSTTARGVSGGVCVRNRGGAVTMSCQMLNMNTRSSSSSGISKRMPPPPPREGAMVAPAAAAAPPSLLRPSFSSRRNSSVAKSLMSFMNAGGAGAGGGGSAPAVVGGLLETRKGAEDGSHHREGGGGGGARALQKPVVPPPLPPPPPPRISVTTAALHERLESLLRESQVFFGLRRSRTAPSTPQAKSKAHNLCIQTNNMADELTMEANHSCLAAGPPYPPTATMPAHLSGNSSSSSSSSSSPSAFDHDDLMRRLHAIAASHHETSTEAPPPPPPPPRPVQNEDSKPALPSLAMDATHKNFFASIMATESSAHCKTNDVLFSEEMSSLRALHMNQIASPGPRSRMRWHQRP